MKMSNADRMRLKSWLEKDPNSEDKGKYLEMDGVTYARTTTYFGPSNEWKVRIAYNLETGYPLVMSSPIPGGQDSKKQAMNVKMVPKLPAKAAPKKPAGGKGKPYTPNAFQKAMEVEMEQLKQQTKKYLSKPSIIWDVATDWDWGIKTAPKKPDVLPVGLTKYAAKGSKALHSLNGFDKLYVMPGAWIPGNYYAARIKGLFITPGGYGWQQVAGSDAYRLVKL